jgi:putative oxidoreductase
MLRRLLRRSVSSHPISLDLGLLLLRLGAGLMLAFGHGLRKINDLGGFTASVARHGLPLPELLGPAAAASEFFGGLLVALGLFTRPSAVFVAITMAVAAFWVNGESPFAKQELALLYGCAALTLVLSGPGAYSVDARRGH